MPVKVIQKGGKPQPTCHFTPFKPAIKAAKQDAIVLESNALEVEDEFADFYDVQGTLANAGKYQAILAPPYPPRHLANLVQQNNALNQLITAMEVNIDGTGYAIESVEETEEETDEDREANKGVEDFFAEVYPGMSWVTVRRKLRRDQETTGNAYLEALRDLAGNLVFLNHVDACTMRFVRLDEPVPVTVSVNRFGQDTEVTLMKRERRYAQLIAGKLTYFKEYGASRDLDKYTGWWAPTGERLPPEQRATEIIHFYPIRDANSPYGVPRWITQTPSVLGSRKAEELNLQFFNVGGLPPALIFLQGGTLTEEVRKQIQAYLSGRGSSYHRGGVVEVLGTGGDLGTPGNVRVTVERFGSERQNDSMFENYDDKCEERTRAAFRLPPIFVGKAQDYSFATAYASYTVAEAQVFKPERQEFDERINNTVMKDIAAGLKHVSQPLRVNDATTQLEGLNLAKEDVDSATLVESVNEIVGLSLHPSDCATAQDEACADTVTEPTEETPEGEADITTTREPQPGEPPARKAEQVDAWEMVDLAREWAAHVSGDANNPDPEGLLARVRRLTKSDRELFDAYVTMNLMSGADHDFEGSVELMGAAGEALVVHKGGCGCGQCGGDDGEG